MKVDSYMRFFFGSALVLPALLCTGCVYRPAFDFSLFSDERGTELAEANTERIEEARTHMFLPIRERRVLPAPKLELNAQVKRELIQMRRGRSIELALERREPHHLALKEIFRDEGLPPELLNLAMIESGFRPEARSPAGAVGMWQLMKSTARLYGLRINLFEDQRKDPILSSLAAARHLRDLYRIYNDWHLALAAYNAGSGKIDRALIRSGASSFWQLANTGHIRGETARFVPRFIAACLLVKEHEQKLASLSS